MASTCLSAPPHSSTGEAVQKQYNWFSKFSSIHLLFRAYHAFYSELNNAEDGAEIENITGCQRPCDYLSYLQVKPLIKYSVHREDTCFVSLWVASPSTTVQTEVLLYPWTSLVAEFGGTLGLFLGVSIMTLWDGGQLAARAAIGIFK